MKVRRSIAAAVAAVVLGTAGALLPTVASAHSTTHTLKFTVVSGKSAGFSGATYGGQETDVSAGKIIGFDDVYARRTGRTRRRRMWRSTSRAASFTACSAPSTQVR